MASQHIVAPASPGLFGRWRGIGDDHRGRRRGRRQDHRCARRTPVRGNDRGDGRPVGLRRRPTRPVSGAARRRPCDGRRARRARRDRTRATRASGSSSRPRPGSSTSTTSRRPRTRAASPAAAYAEPLLDRDSPYSIAPLARSIVALRAGHAAAPRGLPDRRRRAWAAYGPDMIEAQGDFNRPWLVGSFGTEILPAIPDDPRATHRGPAGARRRRRLRRRLGGDRDRRAPTRRCPSTVSISTHRRSRSPARTPATPVSPTGSHSQVRDAADPTAGRRTTSRSIIEAVHDMSQPVEVLAAIRADARPGRRRAHRRREDRGRVHRAGRRRERMFYGYSILSCLPAAMTEQPTAATGTVMRADTLRRLGIEARVPRTSSASTSPSSTRSASTG